MCLQYLRVIAECLKPCGQQAMFYLAAAVSDFFLPWSQMVEHKIQSADGPLHLDLHKVRSTCHICDPSHL